MGNKKPPRYLYHHTRLTALPSIVADGYLKLCPSNLLPPDDATGHLEPLYGPDGKQYGERYWDKNQSYKPVVWLMTEEKPDYEKHGLIPDKTKITFVFRYSPRFVPWIAFADANKMDPAWRYELEKGRKHRTWYICQTEVKIAEAVEIRATADAEEEEAFIRKYLPTAKISRSFSTD